ncbi:unnamed protein product [Rhodiola kirilowii]
MASIFLSRSCQQSRPTSLTSNISSRLHLRLLTSLADPIDLALPEQDVEVSLTLRTVKPRGKDVEDKIIRRGANEKLEDTICRMMANRAWTTRLQNSIRSLVPKFDSSLVYNVLHGARKPDHALQFFRWVERSGLFKHDSETHRKIIEILGGASKLNHARCILLDMPEKGVPWDEDLFVMMIESYGKAGIVQESVKFFDKMKELGIQRTVKSYNYFFKVILQRGRYMMAKRYYNRMLSEGIKPTCHTYNVLLWGFFLSKKVDTAERFFQEMKEGGIAPSVITYNTMIYGYHRVNKMEEAEKIFAEMKARDVVPNEISYTSMIKGYVSVGQLDDALRLYQEMKSADIKPNEFTYSSLLPGLCDTEKLSEAKSMLSEMAERHIAPKDNSVYLKLMMCHCKVGDIDSAVDVLQAMDSLSIPAEAGHYGILIENLCKVGAYDRAVELLDKLVDKEIILVHESKLEMEASAYNPIISHLCSIGQTKKAEVFFRQLMKKGVMDLAAFNELIRGHAREGSPDQAYEILKIMDRRSVPRESESYKLLAESYLKKGESADAKTALDSMLENGHVPESALFRSVMDSLLADERIQTASRVMKSMLEKGVKENLDLVEKILEQLLLREHVMEAIGRVDLLLNSGVQPNFNSILSVLCEQQKTHAALKLLDFGLEKNCSIDNKTYEKVLDALMAAGKTLNAYSILYKIVQKSGVTDWKSGDDLIKSLNEQGNTRQADAISRMLKAGDKVRKSTKVKKQAAAAY